MDTHLVTSDNQFGFKQKHSMDLRLNLLYSIITVLCILVFLMPLRPLTGCKIGPCSKSLY